MDGPEAETFVSVSECGGSGPEISRAHTELFGRRFVRPYSQHTVSRAPASKGQEARKAVGPASSTRPCPGETRLPGAERAVWGKSLHRPYSTSKPRETGRGRQTPMATSSSTGAN